MSGRDKFKSNNRAESPCGCFNNVNNKMQRELSTYPLGPSLKNKLIQSGFMLVEDVYHLKPSELSRETGLSLEDALEVIKTVTENDSDPTGRQSKSPKTQSALEILHTEQNQPNIITFCQQIDDMLGGGVPLCKMTEFCGAPGIGKTQMCMQLCVDVQMPQCLGGVEGQAVYIDTEGSFIVERLVDIADATIQHCNFMLKQNQDDVSELKDFRLENVLKGIHYFRCHDYIELLANIQLLPDFLKEHKQVKLVVVDSIAFHFRHDFEDLSLRTRLLTAMAQNFIKMATNYKLAIVLTNQMTTKVRSGAGSSGQSHLVPALGESWGHASTIRLILHWVGNVRYALLYKSPSRKEKDVPYQITVGGIRDLIHDEDEEMGADNNQPIKRQKIS
ncbi:DNA repair protein RAD51 homolog 3 isoform X2 [Patella vulgata]|uniref:DNA repair protein RAD51 homolog 3 isoform X2 n=1 Tax=Patella vulgata TaxID=6465 RepID=UPI002180543B|nr:DNA repair protein RAD51 homolog 3 isoform X2 [Patella vulgata]